MIAHVYLLDTNVLLAALLAPERLILRWASISQTATKLVFIHERRIFQD